MEYACLSFSGLLQAGDQNPFLGQEKSSLDIDLGIGEQVLLHPFLTSTGFPFPLACSPPNLDSEEREYEIALGLIGMGSDIIELFLRSENLWLVSPILNIML